METIYTGNLGQKLFLYTNKDRIYLRSAIDTDISRPILLGTDYKDSLEGAEITSCASPLGLLIPRE